MVEFRRDGLEYDLSGSERPQLQSIDEPLASQIKQSQSEDVLFQPRPDTRWVVGAGVFQVLLTPKRLGLA